MSDQHLPSGTTAGTGAKPFPAFLHTWLSVVPLMWRAMFHPLKVGIGGWVVAWCIALPGALPGALEGLEFVGCVLGTAAPLALFATLLLGGGVGAVVAQLFFTLPFAAVAVLWNPRDDASDDLEHPLAEDDSAGVLSNPPAAHEASVDDERH